MAVAPVTLDPDATIESREQLAIALKELGWLISLEQSEKGRANQRMQKLLQECEERLVIDFVDHGIAQPFHVRIPLLKTAIENYAREHRDELLADVDGKTVEFAGGKISWRDLPDAIVPIDDNKDVIQRIDKQAHFAEWLQQKLETVILKCGASLGQFLRVTISINLQGIKEALKTGKIKPKALTPLGLQLQTGREQFAIEVNQVNLDGGPAEET